MKFRTLAIFAVLALAVLAKHPRGHKRVEEDSNNLEYGVHIGKSGANADFHAFGATVGGHIDYGSKIGGGAKIDANGNGISAHGDVNKDGGFTVGAGGHVGAFGAHGSYKQDGQGSQ
mmetsp:Transcript_30485/g.27733  ORF Transcript_30485/g.27733 Transcript_30485/m.27733 type:complete len:117 (-) Transcript_30485:824-1174(-)